VKPAIVAGALVLDVVVLGALLWVKGAQDVLVVVVSGVAIALIVAGERLFMWSHTGDDGGMDM
jgi:hypothetical protein